MIGDIMNEKLIKTVDPEIDIFQSGAMTDE
jgi:hypothetical protein